MRIALYMDDRLTLHSAAVRVTLRVCSNVLLIHSSLRAERVIVLSDKQAEKAAISPTRKAQFYSRNRFLTGSKCDFCAPRGF